jgi:hypothetical protein
MRASVYSGSRWLGDGDDGIGGGGLLGALGGGQLDLGRDAVEVPPALAGQPAAAVRVLLCQLEALEGLEDR